MCNERILCAGFGGQGVMSLGQLLTYGGMIEKKHVSWLPSYGPEMRGGTAYCSVVISDSPVGSPVVTGNATCAIIMNLPSLQKFEQTVIPGGMILVNSSLIEQKVERQDIKAYSIPAIELASECGNPKAANMVMLGAYLALSKSLHLLSIIQAFEKVFGTKGKSVIERNIAAIRNGMDTVHGLEQIKKAA